ncbi:MAG TPA: hypothetical protein VMT27_06660 [Actinomycetes bacterium]|nr:hypothetical protein [Actinomycetes bacterium]
MANRTDPEKHRAQVRAANRARYRATQELVAENQERFDVLYAKHAEAEGVTPAPRGRIDAVEIAVEITRLQKRLAALSKDSSSA